MRQTTTKLLGIFALTITSCSSEIQIVKYIDLNSPLTLTINTTNDQTGLTKSDEKMIEPNSILFNKFISWCNNNSTDWESTFASYFAKASVTQKDFRLLYLEEGVVIGFTDKDGEPKQYSKSVKKGELDFLIEKEK